MGKFAEERGSIRRSNKYEISYGTFLHIIIQNMNTILVYN